MRYARVVIFKMKPESMEVTLDLARGGLSRLFRSLPGFCEYRSITTQDGRGVSISEWETKDQAEAALDRARIWVEANIGEHLTIERAYVAPVQISETEDGTELVRGLYGLFNAKSFDSMDDYARPDATMDVVPFGASPTIREDHEAWAAAFPDGTIEIVSIAGDGRRVFAECIGRGTHTGPLAGPAGTIDPTNRTVELHFCDVFDIEGGRITHGRMYFDSAELFDQLGARETPAVDTAWMTEAESRTLH